MKTKLLIAFLSACPIIIANAQQSYGENFFGTVEGSPNNFTIGPISEQKGWHVISPTGQDVDGFSISEDIPTSTLGNWEVSGPTDVKITTDPNLPALEDGTFFSCISPYLGSSSTINTALTAVMILIAPDAILETPGSDYALQYQDANNTITSQVKFAADGSIKILSLAGGVPTYITTSATWTSHEWMQVTINYKFYNNTISYVINGETIYTGSTLTGTTIDHFAFLYNNKAGSTAYFDDLFVFGDSSLGIKNNENQMKFSAFPNPTDGIITISTIENSLIGLVTITDPSGRVIRSFMFDNTSRQIDISDLNEGMYLVSFIAGGKKNVMKVIKR